MMRVMSAQQKRVAILHRYGLGGWICCGGHSIPRVIELFREQGLQVHFFGPKSTDTCPEGVESSVVMHRLPFTWDRRNPTHKWSRTILWYLVLPYLCVNCRIRNMDAVLHIDDTLPLTGWILKIFYGRNTALTVMDFFLRIYTEKHRWLRPAGRFIEWLDVQSWKRTPVLLTKVYFTQTYLAARGIPIENQFIARNPCNHSIFFPLQPERKQAVREKLGFSDDDFVLTHHGIMHPNKGNDWVIERIAELKADIPTIRFMLMGDGPEMSNLRRLTVELGIEEHVLLPGWMPDEKSLNEAIASADIGLVMRIGQETDHFHMTDTLNHEMACAKPIMAANLKGIAEVIRDGENGMLFAPDNPAEFREKLLTLYRDPALRDRLGAAALATSHEVSDLETCARQVADPVLRLATACGRNQSNQ